MVARTPSELLLITASSLSSNTRRTIPRAYVGHRRGRPRFAASTYYGRMTKFAAFLRGVNVGGVNLKMAQVAAVLEDAGFTNVKTILATGNVLLESRSGVDTVRKKAEKALRDEFGYDAWVLAYDLDTVRAISKAFPFEREVEGHHSYVTFVSDPDVLDELAGLAAGAGDDEKIARGEGVVYWQVPRT